MKESKVNLGFFFSATRPVSLRAEGTAFRLSRERDARNRLPSVRIDEPERQAGIKVRDITMQHGLDTYVQS
jgi:hypothetical protein